MEKEKFMLAVFLSVIFLSAIWGTNEVMAVEPIKIGFIHTLSGVYSGYGQDSLTAAQIAVAEINEEGGILGRQLKLIPRDDKMSPVVGLREANDLVLREKVDFLMGTVSSGVGLAISDLARTQKIIFINTTSQASEITADKGHRHVFRISTNTSAYGRSEALAAAKLPYKKYFSIHPNYAYGKSVSASFWEFIKKNHPEIKMVGEAWPALGTTDYTPFISQIMNSGAEAAISSLSGQDGITFSKGAKAFGFFEKIFFVNQDMGALECIGPMGKDGPEGFIGGSHFPFYAINTPESKAFVEKFRKATGAWPGLGVTAYVSVKALAQAVKKAGTVDQDKIIDILSGMEIKNTPVGDMIIQDFDHQATWPFWLGKVKYSEKYGFGILTNPEKFPAEKIYQSREEVMALRAAASK